MSGQFLPQRPKVPQQRKKTFIANTNSLSGVNRTIYTPSAPTAPVVTRTQGSVPPISVVRSV